MKKSRSILLGFGLATLATFLPVRGFEGQPSALAADSPAAPERAMTEEERIYETLLIKLLFQKAIIVSKMAAPAPGNFYVSKSASNFCLCAMEEVDAILKEAEEKNFPAREFKVTKTFFESHKGKNGEFLTREERAKTLCRADRAVDDELIETHGDVLIDFISDLSFVGTYLENSKENLNTEKDHKTCLETFGRALDNLETLLKAGFPVVQDLDLRKIDEMRKDPTFLGNCPEPRKPPQTATKKPAQPNAPKKKSTTQTKKAAP